MNASTNLGSVNPAETRTLSLAFAPDISVPVSGQPQEFALRVWGDNLSEQTVPVLVHVSASGVGGAAIHVSDLFTGSFDTNGQRVAGVSGARVELSLEGGMSFVTNVVTDVWGEVVFDGLPAGRYTVRVGTADHDAARDRLEIQPGMTVTREMFLDMPLVTVEWGVTEIPLEDRYEVTLRTTFKTDVPAPVLTIDPAVVQLPKMKPGETVTGEWTISNHGLIRAKNLQMPREVTDGTTTIEMLAPPPATLEAGRVIRVPYRITCLKAINGNDNGGGYVTYLMHVFLRYEYECDNGVVVTKTVYADVVRTDYRNDPADVPTIRPEPPRKVRDWPYQVSRRSVVRDNPLRIGRGLDMKYGYGPTYGDGLPDKGIVCPQNGDGGGGSCVPKWDSCWKGTVAPQTPGLVVKKFPDSDFAGSCWEAGGSTS